MNAAAASTRAPREASAWQGFLTLLGASVLAIVLCVPVATRLEPTVSDALLFGFFERKQPQNDDIVIVTITEETLAQFPYRSPIDRAFLAQLLTGLDAAAPKGIGLDLLLDGPSDPAKDEALQTALDSISTPLVMAVAGPSASLTDLQLRYLDEATKGKSTGSIVLLRDETDGIVRHLPEVEDGSGGHRQTFAGALARIAGVTAPGGGRILYRQNITASEPAFPHYPAHMVSLLPKDWFKDKLVLIGTDLPATDRHPTPLIALQGTAQGTLPGIAVHAHILAQALEARDLPTLSFVQTIVLIALAAFGSALFFPCLRRPGLFFALLALAIAGYEIVLWGLLSRGIVYLPVLSPPLAAICSALAMALRRWQRDRSERAFLKTAFSHYVSPSVVGRLSSGDLKLALGGEKRQVTYIFTDLEGFTSLSETLPPDRVADLLNRYLDGMCDLMTRHGATIDKIIGDAVVGFFGAPEADPDQAAHAVELALEMDGFCEGFRKTATLEGLKLGQTRIGVHRGDAVIGNFGGSRFFDYTGIGDTVNTAARLEGANRYLGTRICVSVEVVRNCPGLPFRPLGELVLKGRKEPLACFEPLTLEMVSNPWLETYIKAYGLMADGKTAAMAAFEAAARQAPKDGPARLHLGRLQSGETGAIVTLSGK